MKDLEKIVPVNDLIAFFPMVIFCSAIGDLIPSKSGTRENDRLFGNSGFFFNFHFRGPRRKRFA
jgi:hypothetical protein